MKLPSLRVSLTLCALLHAYVPALLPAATAQQQGGTTQEASVSVEVEKGKFMPLYAKSYALVIGASEYTEGWPKLPDVKEDVEAVEHALQRQGFKVTVVMNPNSELLEKSFKEFIDQHGGEINNRLLFYFAGHGHTERQSYGEEMGYIVPVDAPNPERDLTGFKRKAMPMDQMEMYARKIEAKHALFLFDSCFSGSVFYITRALPQSISYKTTQYVRQFITSGSADERVPAKSYFRDQFIEAIEGEADGNPRDGYVTGTELGEFLQNKVINYSRDAQHPQYGKIRNPRLDKGDFVFVLPETPTPPPAAASNDLGVEVAFWNSIQSGNDPEDLKEYLDKYPSGQFANVARRRLAGATRGAKPGPVVTNRIGMEFVYVPAGSFTMGSVNGEANEKPAHQVRISSGFNMGRYEVTQAQWQAVMGTNPSNFKFFCPDEQAPRTRTTTPPCLKPCDNCPVEQVSWNDAQEFLGKLNAMNDGFEYRLPSEAEWEYAARAGMAGDDVENLDAMAWHAGNSADKTHPVGLKQANAFGLYDIYGNVMEWVQDVYHENYIGAPADGSAWVSGGDSKFRMLRGGSWISEADFIRSASRGWNRVVSNEEKKSLSVKKVDGAKDDAKESPDIVSGTNLGFRVLAIARK